MAANKSGSGGSATAGDEGSAKDINNGDEAKDDKKVDDVVDAEFKEVKRD